MINTYNRIFHAPCCCGYDPGCCPGTKFPPILHLTWTGNSAWVGPQLTPYYGVPRTFPLNFTILHDGPDYTQQAWVNTFITAEVLAPYPFFVVPPDNGIPTKYQTAVQFILYCNKDGGTLQGGPVFVLDVYSYFLFYSSVYPLGNINGGLGGAFSRNYPYTPWHGNGGLPMPPATYDIIKCAPIYMTMTSERILRAPYFNGNSLAFVSGPIYKFDNVNGINIANLVLMDKVIITP